MIRKMNRFPARISKGSACNCLVKKKLSSETCLSRFDRGNAGSLQKHLPEKRVSIQREKHS